MEDLFDTPDMKLAVTGTDEDIYPHLSILNHSPFEQGDFPKHYCRSIHPIDYLEKGYEARPETLPLKREDLEHFRDNELQSFPKGHWSVPWLIVRQHSDIVYQDGFRTVFLFRTFEFMVRPVHDIHGGSAERLRLGLGDVEVCLNDALKTNLNSPMMVTLGRGVNQVQQAAFEWRIDRASEVKINQRVRDWRYTACGGYKDYTEKQREYTRLYKLQTFMENRAGARDPASTQPESLFRPYVPPIHPPSPVRKPAKKPRGKRSSKDMSGREGSSSRKKRATGGAQSGSSSQAGSASQSSASSPEILRPQSIASLGPQPIMGPPTEQGHGHQGTSMERPILQPRSRMGSSAGSTSSRASLGFSGMALQPQDRGSPASLPPSVGSPPGGTPWGTPLGTPPGMPSGTFGQPGAFPQQYNQGQFQQAPGAGQPTMVYGHLDYNFQPSLPRGPPRIGSEYSQTAYGHWTPPQAPAQGSRQYSHAGFVNTQPGGEFAGGQSYPSRYPPAQPAMPATGFNLSQSPGAGTGPSNFPSASPAGGFNVFQFQDFSGDPSSGAGSDPLPHQEVLRSTPAGWFDRAGSFHPWSEYTR